MRAARRIAAAAQWLALAGSAAQYRQTPWAPPSQVIRDSPGLGPFAWRAARQRDVPLLVNIGMLITIVMVLANSAAELAGDSR